MIDKEQEINIIKELIDEYKNDLNFLREITKNISVLSKYDIEKLKILYQKYNGKKDVKIDYSNAREIIGELSFLINLKLESMILTDYLGLIRSEDVSKVVKEEFVKTTKLDKATEKYLE